MHDMVIKNGRVVDGTGAEPFIADVAVDGGTVVEVGRSLGGARRVVDAEGRVVMPGWVDIHSHYDAQATWDQLLSPSCWHGVTTSIFGNCGVGFAPIRKGDEPYLMNLMSGVEDIPEAVLAEGIDFCWESYAGYLDTLSRLPRVMDVGSQIPHGALRYYVMGARGADPLERPTPAEEQEMGRLVEEALRAGALGFTTSRTLKHRTGDGRNVPTLHAQRDELLAIAQGMRRAGTGVFEVNSDFEEGEFEFLREVSVVAQRPLSILIVQVRDHPDRWRQTLRKIEAAHTEDLPVVGQTSVKLIGVQLGLETSINPFTNHATWKELQHLTPAARFDALKNDAALRARLVHEQPPAPPPPLTPGFFEITFEVTDPHSYEPTPDRSIAAQARERGTSPWQLALDILLSNDGQGMLAFANENYCEGNLDAVREMLASDRSVSGGADAGAHVGYICDASNPTHLLAYWARDRGEDRFPLERMVRKGTRDSALHYGLRDRGVLAPGYKADINVLDFERLKVLRPSVAYDMPAGGKRLLQRSLGYCHTFVSGVEVMRAGEPTGNFPGRLVRGSQPDPRQPRPASAHAPR